VNHARLIGCFLMAVFLLCTEAFGQMPALSPLPQTGSLIQPSDPNNFVFAIAGDNRPAHKGCPQSLMPGKIFAALNNLSPQPAFVLWTGDTISGKQLDQSAIQGEYIEFLKIAATGGMPVFNSPGNHEMDDENNVPSDVMKGFYKKFMAEPEGAFSYGNSRFIALDSEHEPAKKKKAALAAKSGSEGPPGSLTHKQLVALDSDLSQNTDKTHIIIFMHHPVEPYKPEDGLDKHSVHALKKVLAKYSNISYVVSGHEHMYFNPQGDPDKFSNPPSRTDPSQPQKPAPPPFYLVSGGAGAPLKKNTGGTFYNYIVFNVEGATIVPTLVNLGSNDPSAPCNKK
jgi:hypothetical protein